VRVMVELPLGEAQAVTGQILDRDLEEAAIQRIERALRVEQSSLGNASTPERDGEDR